MTYVIPSDDSIVLYTLQKAQLSTMPTVHECLEFLTASLHQSINIAELSLGLIHKYTKYLIEFLRYVTISGRNSSSDLRKCFNNHLMLINLHTIL